MKRRRFLAATALGALGVVPAVAATVEAADAAPRADALPNSAAEFPSSFAWGAATAAYQVEGGVHEGGRAPSIWDTFSHTPGKTANGDTGDVACDHYHRFESDVALLAELGVKHYRFSISWPRIIPQGRGPVNEKGVDFYRRLVDALHRHGIVPHATLYHWDLPQALQDRYGGWQSREAADDFAAYAGAAARRLDGIRHWMTLNEIATFCIYCGYGVGSPGSHAPGLALARPRDRWQVVHHALLAHGRGCQAIRAASSGKCYVGIAENFEAFVPLIETPENVDAVRRAFTRTEVNGAIIVPLLTGRYDPHWLADRGAEAPVVREGDMKIIAQPLDGLGFNCYTGSYVRAYDADGYTVLPMFENYPKANMPWLNIVPEAIYWGIRMVGDALGQPKLPIFISENGCADGAPPRFDVRGEILDTDRIMFLRAYLRQVHRAVSEGRPVIGYFPWSLMDNYEWAEGYRKRFGLVHVNYSTQVRQPKASYRWYQSVIRSGRIL